MLKKAFVIAGFMMAATLSAQADGVGVNTSAPAKFPEQTGDGLYKALCQACHMAQAQGATGAGSYPPLAKNDDLSNARFVANIIMYGRSGMPALGGVLDDNQISMIINYVRSNFGNSFDGEVSPDNVKALRKPNFQFIDMN